MDFARRQAYFGLFDGYHCYGPLENHLPNATCHGHDIEVPKIPKMCELVPKLTCKIPFR